MGLKEAYGSEEWEFIVKLGQSMHDPEQRSAFKEMIMQKKQLDPSYSIYSDFPKAEQNQSEKERIAKLYCGPILELLKKHVIQKEEI